MHATVRKMNTKSGKADRVADLIENQYIPRLAQLDGVVSFTLMQTSHNEVTSLAIYANETASIAGKGLAQMFLDEKLAKLLAGSPEVLDGPVLLHAGQVD
jgi:hypothetical protein